MTRINGLNAAGFKKRRLRLYNSCPEIAIQRPVLDRFADVVGLNGWSCIQVGDGAGHFQDAVVGAGAEVQFGHRHFDEVLSGFVELAVGLEMTRGHPGIAGDFTFPETFALDGARGLHAFADDF